MKDPAGIEPAASSERQSGPGVEPAGVEPAGVEPAGVERPDDTDLPLDAHLHTILSPDADAAIDAHAAAAVERGIEEIAITDHLDFEPGTPAYAFADYPTRERYVREAAQRWADRGVTIRFGIEITYQRRHEEAIREHLAHCWPATRGRRAGPRRGSRGGRSPRSSRRTSTRSSARSRASCSTRSGTSTT